MPLQKYANFRVFFYLLKTVVPKILAHEEDVNTVAYADETSQIFFSGSDDGICKVIDFLLFILI